jgi:16S rRNA (cytosine1402-N4)-methyltransferase
MFAHKPVMVQQVLEFLDIRSSDTVIDCTLGEGGHASHFLSRIEEGLVIGIEQDEEILGRAKQRLKDKVDRFLPVLGNFSDLREIANKRIGGPADKIFFDLGISMFHFKISGRGFGFSQNEPLDMRLDRSRSLSAGDVVNNFQEKKLAEIIWAYGEERFSNRIASFIVKERTKRPITMTQELADTVSRAIPRRYWPKSIHPATKTFQALRIFVNDEIEILENALRDGIDLLRQGGRICVISFHSLEDRIVKSVFRELSRGCTCPPDFPVCVCGKKKVIRTVTKRPLVPDDDELKVNPASRSARLRCALKIGKGSNNTAASMQVSA